MRRGHSILQPRDVQQACFQIHLVPAQRDELRDAQPMPVGDEDQRAIARTVAAELARGLQELLDLIGGQVLALAPRGVGLARRGGRGEPGVPQIAALMASYCAGGRRLSHLRVLARILPLLIFRGLRRWHA
jgi:hypothetical protein